MKFLDFKLELKDFPVFNLNDIKKLNTMISYANIIAWQKKGYLNRIVNGVFAFSDRELDDNIIWYLANKIYEPSYISLESAFSFYGFIPEIIFNLYSVSTKKTKLFGYNNMSFNYRTISHNYFFGYTLNDYNNIVIKIAEPEKSIIDYFYLNSNINSLDQIRELRFNKEIVRDKINWKKLEDYTSYFKVKTVTNRIEFFKKWILDVKH